MNIDLSKLMKTYVGHTKQNTLEVFTASKKPTSRSNGQTYVAVIGPFDTSKGAEYFQKHGKANPHCQTVDQAEKAAV